jgi:ABC-type sugar transport system ATPase subunit
LELYHYPANLFVAGFIGSPRMNFIPGRLAHIEPNGATVKLVDGATVRVAVDATTSQPDDAVTLGIRPEHLVVGNGQGNSTQGEVSYMEHLGEASFIYTRVNGVEDHVIIRLEGDIEAQIGSHVPVGFPAENCHLFDDEGRAYRRLVESAAETEPVV